MKSCYDMIMEERKAENEKMMQGIAAANLRGAQRKGYATMEEYSKAKSVADRKAAYVAKIAQYEKAIAEMKAYIETH